MIVSHFKRRWIPYAVLTVGVFTSVILAFILWFDIQAYFKFLQAVDDFVPWFTLVIGSGLSALLARLIRLTQLAENHAQELDTINENIKKEIAERIQAEDSKQKLEIALLQGQKLQAMGTLAGGIAHDFNNILYAIIGYAEMTREDTDKNSLAYANLGKILEATDRGKDLVARILSFSRRQHHHFDALSMNHTIEAALSLLRPTIPASVSISYSCDRDALIMGNQTQIHQVLVNLINNAVDAMDEEGNIRIHVSNLQATDPSLNSAQIPEGDHAVLCKVEISDTGQGMDQRTMARIFEPFYTTKEVGKGTGLGLSIVHNIMKEHGGSISVNSQLGKGTTFTLLFPEVKEEASSEQKAR